MTEHILNRGLFISVEGLDGSGKSTLANGLHEHLQHMGYPSYVTREPGGTDVGSHIRSTLHAGVDDPQAEFLLFAADRAAHMKNVVIPYRDAGTIVISDRSADSSCAYQGYGRGVDTDMISQINQWAMQACKPDVVIYMHMTPQQIHERIHQRNDDMSAFEQEQVDFFERVHAGFEEIFADRDNVIRIDATQRVQEVLEEAIDGVMPYIRAKHMDNS